MITKSSKMDGNSKDTNTCFRLTNAHFNLISSIEVAARKSVRFKVARCYHIPKES